MLENSPNLLIGYFRISVLVINFLESLNFLAVKGLVKNRKKTKCKLLVKTISLLFNNQK